MALRARLAAVPGVRAVVLGGSRARGRSRPDSDGHLGLLYSEASPIAIEALRTLAVEVTALVESRDHGSRFVEGRAPESAERTVLAR